MKTEFEVTASVHWLSVTVFVDWRELVRAVAAALQVKTWAFEPMGRAIGYARAELGPLGVKVYGEPISGPVQSHLVVPGGAIEELGDAWLYGLMDEFERRNWRWRASRVDLALDGGQFTPEDCLREWEKGEVRTYSRRDHYKVDHSSEGMTFTMGSRKSERVGRVYDRRGFTRVELEAKGDRAEAVWLALWVSAADRRPELIKGHVLDFVEFAAPWWKELMGKATRAMLKIGSVAHVTADRMRQWVRKQVAPTLAALVELDGGALDFVSELLTEGRGRYRTKHRLVLAKVYA